MQHDLEDENGEPLLEAHHEWLRCPEKYIRESFLPERSMDMTARLKAMHEARIKMAKNG